MSNYGWGGPTYGSFRSVRPVPKVKYTTYKRDVSLGEGQVLGYTPGYGYYAKDDPLAYARRRRGAGGKY